MDVFKTYTLNISAFFAVSINTILITLITTRSPSSLGSYKYLMIYIAFIELVYAILSVSQKPEIFTKNSAFLILIDTKTSVYPREAAPILNLLFIGFYGITISTLAIHFVYRYLAVSNGEWLTTFQDCRLVLWLLFPILSGITWMLGGGVIFKPTEDSDRFLRTFYPPIVSNSTLLEDCYYVGPFYYPEDCNGDVYIHWRHFGGSALVLTLIFQSFTTMTYFGTKCYREMKNLMSLATTSDKNQSIQAQLFYALLVQSIIPVFLMHIPATAVYVAIFINSAGEIVGNTLTITIAMYPALNPIPTIVIVKSYRQAVKAFLHRLICKEVPVEPISGFAACSMRTRSVIDNNN